MDIEQWLEEAMVITNRSLRLMPSSVFRQCVESCRSKGASLVAVARAGSQLGLVDEAKLLQLKERIPEPSKTPPTHEEILAYKRNLATQIETCRFWMNYMIGASKEIPVIMDLQPTDEKDDELIRRVMGNLVGQILQGDKESHKGGEDGNGNNYSS
jgi:hypothetical protein